MIYIFLLFFLLVLFPVSLLILFFVSIKYLRQRKARIKKWDNLVDTLTKKFSCGETDETEKTL